MILWDGSASRNMYGNFLWLLFNFLINRYFDTKAKGHIYIKFDAVDTCPFRIPIKTEHVEVKENVQYADMKIVLVASQIKKAQSLVVD